MELRKGDRVELKSDNQTGIGKKGQPGSIVELLYKPVDEYDYIVKFEDGTTEAFLKRNLLKKIKHLTKIV